MLSKWGRDHSVTTALVTEDVSRYVEASLCHPALPHDLWKVKDREGLLALLSAIITCVKFRKQLQKKNL